MENRQGKLHIVVLAVCLAGLMLAVAGIFKGLEIMSSQARTVPEEYQVLDADSGQPSDYYVTIGAPDEGPNQDYARQWLSNCTGGRGYYWLTHEQTGRWDLFVYLPQLKELAGDLERGDVTVRTEDMGMHAVLYIYITTRADAGQDREAQDQLLRFQGRSGVERPGNVKVFVDGEALESSGHCLYDRGQWNWYSN